MKYLAFILLTVLLSSCAGPARIPTSEVSSNDASAAIAAASELGRFIPGNCDLMNIQKDTNGFLFVFGCRDEVHFVFVDRSGRKATFVKPH
jgi:hypothetical protein